MQVQRQRAEAAALAPSTVGILAVDDHRVFREVLIDIIDATRGFFLVGQATTGEEAIRAVERLSPQLVLMDVCMPGMDGIEATRTILNRHPDVVVILISVDDPSLFRGAASFGDAVSCVRKQDLAPRRLKQLWEAHAH